MEDGLSGIAADVATYGWTVMRVSADGPGPDFAYSIGMVRTLGHPEIFIAGLPLDTAHRLINDVGASVKAGHRYRAGETSEEFLEGYSVTFRVVPRHQYGAYLGWGLRFYGDDTFPVLQFVYPDRHHRWPWHEGVTADFRATQPVLADESEPPWAHDPAV